MTEKIREESYQMREFRLEMEAAKKKVHKTKRVKRVKEEHIPYRHTVEPLTAEEKTFRHKNWLAKRERVIVELQRSGASDHKCVDFEECGNQMSIRYSPSERRYSIHANCCHCRHCEPCMRSRGQLIAKNLHAALCSRYKSDFRFITLTLKHSNLALRAQIKRLYTCFKKLRAGKLWKRTQKGGAAMLEVKYDAGKRAWHPHLHIVSEGDFVNQWQLSAEWLRVTGDSPIVDVRLLKSDRDAAYYVAKYITKGTSDSVWLDSESAQEWIAAIKGVRICYTFGIWKGEKLTKKPPDPKDWKDLGRLDAIITRAKAGEHAAQGILREIRYDACIEHFDRPRYYEDGEGG